VGLQDGWYLFGGGRFDIENNYLARSTLGLEFDCECMNFKMAYSSSKDGVTESTDHRVMVSIDLATLGGTAVSSKF
jgi:LPS-assembly protein